MLKAKPNNLIAGRKYRFTAIIALFLFILVGCEEELPMPDACIEGPANGVTGEEVEFTICTTDADYMSIWTGEPTHEYSLRNDTTLRDERGRFIDNQGYDVTGETSFVYIYFEPGTFTVTVVANNVGDNGKLIKTSTDEMVITITESD